ncbi:Oligosaccharide flippase family protein [Rhodovastum atsumiense]|nr:Oligosaccharide flippase family protein [Rhodovastum atsumiense]
MRLMRILKSNVFWSGLEAAVAAALSFVSAFVIARIVGPAELGVGAAAVAVHILVWVAVNGLFADPLVQRAGLTDEEASSAFWASVLGGVIGVGLQVAAGWAVMAAIGDPRLLAMTLVLAATLPLVGAGGAMQGLLTRQRQYRVLAGRTLLGQGLGTLVGMALAWGGAGAWALVLQQLTTSLGGALALLLGGGWRPRPVLRLAPVLALLRFGAPLVASTLVVNGRYRLFAVLIGGTAGPAALGQVHMAFRLVDTVRELACTAMWRLSLPSLSERQGDLPALRRAVSRLVELSGVVLFPAMGALLVIIDPLVHLLLGPGWAPAATAAGPLILLACYTFLAFPTSVALLARGATLPALASSVATLAIMTAGVLLLRPETPAMAALVWVGAQAVVIPPMLVVNGRILQGSVLALLRPGLPALLLAAAATTAALLVPRALGEPTAPLAVMACRLGVGMSVYIPGALLLLRPSIAAALGSFGFRDRPV